MNTQVKTILNNEEMLKKMLSEIDRVCKIRIIIYKSS